MAKSLEEVMKKIQLEHEQRQQTRQAEEQKISMLAEQQRRQWAERNRMFEKSTTTSAASSAAAGAGAGGSRSLLTNFIVFEYYSMKLGMVKKDGTVQDTNVQPFDGRTALASCSDDPDFLYFVTNSDGDVSFGKMNRRTLERIEITSNLGTLTDKNPASLVYTGEGVFYYVDAFMDYDDDDYNDTFTITFENGATEAVVEQIGQLDHSNVYPEAVFKYGNQWYMSAVESSFVSALYLVDIENSLTELVGYYMMDHASLPAGIGPTTKVWYVFDTIVENGKIYGSVIFTDKDNGAYPHACVGEIVLNDLEPENPYIKYLYSLPDPFGETNYTYTSIDIR